MSEAVSNVFVATGRRKRASARVRMRAEGSGQITINGKPLEQYMYSEQLVRLSTLPLETVEKVGEFDVDVKVFGGGPFGQAGAVSLGLARALEKFDAELRAPLKKAGLLKRDPRRRERKKAGQPGARKRFQFSKR